MATTSISFTETPLLNLVLRRADDALILGHRLSEWCGHAPMVEEDIALANINFANMLALIGAAFARVVPGRFGYWLDLGLIMFALYLCGCAVGSWLRGWVVSRSAPSA